MFLFLKQMKDIAFKKKLPYIYIYIYILKKKLFRFFDSQICFFYYGY